MAQWRPDLHHLDTMHRVSFCMARSASRYNKTSEASIDVSHPLLSFGWSEKGLVGAATAASVTITWVHSGPKRSSHLAPLHGFPLLF